MRAWSAGAFQPIVLIPVVFAIECTRAALWAARALYEPDHDGGLIRALLALFIGLLGLLPSPIWTVGMYVLCIVWMPVRGILWLWGIGRGSLRKQSPAAVTNWYAYTRKRRAEAVRRQQSSL